MLQKYSTIRFLIRKLLNLLLVITFLCGLSETLFAQSKDVSRDSELQKKERELEALLKLGSVAEIKPLNPDVEKKDIALIHETEANAISETIAIGKDIAEIEKEKSLVAEIRSNQSTESESYKDMKGSSSLSQKDDSKILKSKDNNESINQNGIDQVKVDSQSEISVKSKVRADSGDPSRHANEGLSKTEENEHLGEKSVSGERGRNSSELKHSAKNEGDVEATIDRLRLQLSELSIENAKLKEDLKVQRESKEQVSNMSDEVARGLAEKSKKVHILEKKLEEALGRLLLAETEIERLNDILQSSEDLNEVTRNKNAGNNVNRQYNASKPKYGYALGGANLYTGPGTSNQVLRQLQRGEKLLLRGNYSSWYQVVTKNGVKGWVQRSSISYTPQNVIEDLGNKKLSPRLPQKEMFSGEIGLTQEELKAFEMFQRKSSGN